ncbi:MAG: serine hydrolase domain-containing protein [Planctomycetota bacterium]|nr:serine hydrolase domain-containing protein [Planctomycetota bacterium]MEC9049052.1 serine hydrolase domain-containing protein [Planctomycetota bacterium]
MTSQGLLSCVLALAPAVTSQGEQVDLVDQGALRAAVSRFAESVEADHVLGAVLMVTQGDRVLVHEALGHRDVARRRPMQRDTLFRMASNTKAVTAAAVLSLVERGKVALDEPIAKWFPTFDGGRGREVTIRQLLTHSSGLRIPTLFVYPLTVKSDEHPDAPNLVMECARFGAIGPDAAPGETYSYSNPGYNLLAGVVELASGQPFADYCAARFYEPLEMTDSCHHETVADNDRMSAVVKEQADGGWSVRWRPHGPPTVPFVRGSGGMISTAADFERFARLFLEGGARGDQQLLAPASVRAATRDQIPHIAAERYGFGWRITDWGFSHSGSDGTYAWCAPDRDLVGLVFTQTQTTKALTKARQRFRADVLAAVTPSADAGR